MWFKQRSTTTCKYQDTQWYDKQRYIFSIGWVFHVAHARFCAFEGGSLQHFTEI